MTAGFSIILPIHNQEDHLESLVESYEGTLRRIPVAHELILVTNGCTDSSAEIAGNLAASYPATVRWLDSPEKGWGAAVRHGLRHATLQSLCYTNSARTSAEDLVLFLLYANAYPNVIVKANRKIRESWVRRLGSLLYNIECRALFGLPQWDINGTPKVFPRNFDKLLQLTRDDDLIDLEFNVACSQNSYPLIEVPMISFRRHGGRSTTGFKSALMLYWGCFRLWRSTRRKAA